MVWSGAPSRAMGPSWCGRNRADLMQKKLRMKGSFLRNGLVRIGVVGGEMAGLQQFAWCRSTGKGPSRCESFLSGTPLIAQARMVAISLLCADCLQQCGGKYRLPILTRCKFGDIFHSIRKRDWNGLRPERVRQSQRGVEAGVILVQDQVHALKFTQLLHELRANVGSE